MYPKKLSIIIPVYNEKDTLLEILKQVDQAPTLGLEKEIKKAMKNIVYDKPTKSILKKIITL